MTADSMRAQIDTTIQDLSVALEQIQLAFRDLPPAEDRTTTQDALVTLASGFATCMASVAASLVELRDVATSR